MTASPTLPEKRKRMLRYMLLRALKARERTTIQGRNNRKISARTSPAGGNTWLITA